MRVIKQWISLILLSLVMPLQAQESFNIVSLDGRARVQRSQKRAWEQLSLGGKLYDNDLVETFFQTKLIMQFGTNNLVILGSNSKALLNIAAKKDGDRTITEISLTLFSGGIFSKAINNCHITIYTANAVGVMDSGSVSTVAEGKTGETGFQVLGGSIFVRNIAQQKGIELRSGLTTMIQPNKEPTAPLYITHRHVAVLKHYFGDEYIVSELDASGIKPTDERNTTNYSRLSAFSTKPKNYVDEGFHKPLFSLSRIYGGILEDRSKNYFFFQPILPDLQPVEGKGMVSLQADFGIYGQGVYPRVMPMFRYQLGPISTGIRLNFVKTDSLGFTAGFSSLNAILDKIEHLSYGTPIDRWSLYLGPLHDITFGYGLMVKNFSNLNFNNSFHPLGAIGRVRLRNDLSIEAFTSNITAPYVSGLYTSFTPSNYSFSVGYIADFNQYKNFIDVTEQRYVPYPSSDSLVPDQERKHSSVHCYTVDVTVDIFARYNANMKFLFEFAHKLFEGNDGFVLRAPSLLIDVKKCQFGGGVVLEAGRLISNQFGPMYFDNRYRIKSSQWSNGIDTVITPNNVLDRKRNTLGFSIDFKINPYRGTAVEFYYKQDIFSRHSHLEYIADSTTTRNITGDFSFRLKAAINDSLVKYIRYAEIVLQQSHGRLYPFGGMVFNSWTFLGSYNVVSIPLFFNIAFETGGHFFYIDTGNRRNDLIDGDDFHFQVSAGINWGFK